MPTAQAHGVPTLRSALRRAERLGAHVERVNATGQVLVTHGETRLKINARRKDATRELASLIYELEIDTAGGTRVAPTSEQLRIPEAEPMPANGAKPIRPIVTRAERIRKHLRQETQPDPAGWRPYNSATIAEALGVSSTDVAAWAGNGERVHTLELGREGRWVRWVRFADEVPMGKENVRPATVADRAPPTTTVPVPVADYRDQPLRVVEGPEPVGMLDVPGLREYAEAIKAARNNRLLRVGLEGEALDKVLAEAVRLYYWAKAGGGR